MKTVVTKSPGEKILDAIYRGDLRYLRYVPEKGKQMMDDLKRLNEACKEINKVLGYGQEQK